MNIFSWVNKEKAKAREMDSFEEKVANTDMQMEVVETNLDREARLCRVRVRQREFVTRRVVKDVLEDILAEVSRYRSTQITTEVLEDVLTDVMEYTLINKVIKEVMDTGPGVTLKLDRKFMTRRLVQEILEVLIMEEVPAEVSRKKRILIQVSKKKEWAAR